MAIPDIPDTMRAAQVTRFDAENPELSVAEIPVPQPERGQVVVKMSHAPINPSDLMFLSGRYGFTKRTPATPGFEGSGLVVKSGGGFLANRIVGKRVACAIQDKPGGTWAEYLVTDATLCLDIPDRVTDEEAASLVVNPSTAVALLGSAKQGRHRAAVQTAAASTVGKMIARLSARSGYPVVHIVRRAAQVETLEGLGAEHVLDSSQDGFAAKLKPLCERLGATALLDAVAGPATGELLSLMPSGTHAWVYGGLSQQPATADPLDLIFRDQHVHGFWLSSWLAKKGLIGTVMTLRAVSKQLAGDLKTDIAHKVPLEEFAAGIKRYEENMSRGKVLLEL